MEIMKKIDNLTAKKNKNTLNLPLLIYLPALEGLESCSKT